MATTFHTLTVAGVAELTELSRALKNTRYGAYLDTLLMSTSR